MKQTARKAAAAATALLMIAAFPGGTVVVDDADGGPGIGFSTSGPYSTPFEFTADEAQIGRGSLEVLPITNDTGDAAKFIAYLGEWDENGDAVPFDLEEVSFDFLVENDRVDQSDGGSTDVDEQFYLNVYWELEGVEYGWYDCRYDYTGNDLAVPGTWTTLTNDATPSGQGSNGAACPADPSATGMPEGAQAMYAAINVGDTSGNDEGAGGFIDNVQITVDGVTTTYDLEVNPETKDDCKKGGWEDYGFRNQGQCVSWVASSR